MRWIANTSEQRPCSKQCVDDVTLWAQQGRARTPTRRRFALSEKTSFTTMISYNDYKTA